ncbi:MAG: S8 family serine peptidase, partial [Flavobacteriales bacterium]
APSDAEGILAVGAADAQENHAWFSSYGPAADGRVKPDVSAMGAATAYAAQDSTIRTGNGTSFSSPLIAASTACLLQAFPSTPSHALRDAVIRSASAYTAPTDSLGYGIPDYYTAWKMLRGEGLETGDFGASVFPNPCTQSMRVTLDDAKSCTVDFTIYDALGRRVVTTGGMAVTDGHGSFSMDDVVSRLPAGRYTLHVHWELRNSVVSFTKISTP